MLIGDQIQKSLENLDETAEEGVRAIDIILAWFHSLTFTDKTIIVAVVAFVLWMIVIKIRGRR